MTFKELEKQYREAEDRLELDCFPIFKPINRPVCDEAISLRPELANRSFRVDEFQDHFLVTVDMVERDGNKFICRVTDPAHAVRLVCQQVTPSTLTVTIHKDYIEVIVG